MAFFPNQIMPKRLKRETDKEVDNSPLVYNARDYNIHHREIREIQRLLIGSAGGGAAAGGSTGSGGATTGSGSEPGQEASAGGQDSGGMALSDALVRFTEIIHLVATQGFMGLYSGTVQSGGAIELPQVVISTQTSGSVPAGATTIPVVSTAGFPNSGVITKFNRLDTSEVCSDGSAPGGGSRCALGSQKVVGYTGLVTSGSHATNQERISYTGKTGTSFTGCTRSVNGSTAQPASDAEPALVVSGRAAISFGHNFWGRGTPGTPNQFYLAHDALLRTTAVLKARGSRTRQGRDLQDHIEISWLLSYVGYFASVDMDQVFSPTG